MLFRSISRFDMDRWGDWWRLTTLSAKRLFERSFASPNIVIESHGNVLAATGFLLGLAAEELTTKELNHHDPDYQLLITVRATRGGGEK